MFQFHHYTVYRRIIRINKMPSSKHLIYLFKMMDALIQKHLAKILIMSMA